MTMLLYRTAVAPLSKADREDWFTIAGVGGVTEWDDAKFLVNDVTDGPDEVRWDHLKDAKVVGLHDDDEVTQDDPRFNGEDDDESNFAVVRSPSGNVFLAITINVPEALLMQKADFAPGGKTFEFGEKLELAWEVEREKLAQ
jgi:hypothetical protein